MDVIRNNDQRALDPSARYARQIGLLSSLSSEPQKQLHRSKVLVVGAGGLGAPILYYLASAGVGTIVLVDNDIVTESNLQRQILYTENDLGQPKALCAAKRLVQMNRSLVVEAHTTRFTKENSNELSRGVDLIIDGTDNMPTRYLLDKVAQQQGVPYLYGAVGEWQGMCTLFTPTSTTRLADLWPEDEMCQTNIAPPQVLGALPGVMGSIMAAEAIKVLLSKRSDLEGRMVVVTLSPLSLTTYAI